MDTKQKPTVQLTGTDGNVFALLGRCTQALKRAGMHDEATKLAKDVMSCGSYDEALVLMMEAVDVR
jgi:hypothetical protein